MDNPWNASSEELTDWAYGDDPTWPEQDWDLAVTSDENAALIFALASDPACPNREFFLRCLYLLVGDAVRSDFVAHARQVVDALLANVDASSPADLVRWRERARGLLAHVPATVDHDLWCDGGYVRSDESTGEPTRLRDPNVARRTQMASDSTPEYWFRAKRYGWGWGWPSAWQGWVALTTYLALVVGAIPLVRLSGGIVLYLACVAVLTVAFVALCWLKGEPPRWRWDGRDD